MNQYKLAVIIPSWNCEKYIGKMLDSILSNTFTNWRCYIVDDQSIDGSVDVIRKYQEKDNRIILKVRDREPKGAQTCRNIGFEMSEEAEYVIWFDSDDVIAPYCFEQRVSYMERHPDLDFGIFPAKRFSLFPLEYNTDIWGYDYMGDTLRCFLNRTLMIVGWTNIYRRQSIICKELNWDVNVSSLQDADWNIQAICSGMSFEYASKENAKIDYFYRTVPDGIASKIRTSLQCKSHLYHIDKTLHTLSRNQLIKYDRDIASCLVEFAILFFSNDKETFNKFLKLEWFKSHKYLLIRLRLYYQLNGRGGNKLFVKEHKYHNDIHSEWWKFKELHYKKIIKDNQPRIRF